MSDVDYHFFREIVEQVEVWKSIALRVNEVQEVLEKGLEFRPALVSVSGRGSSAFAAKLIARHSEQKLKVPSRFFPIEDSGKGADQTSHSSELAFPPGIGFVVSQSGQSPDLLSCAEELRKHTEFLVAITNSVRSPLATLADAHLHVGASSELAVAATKTFSGSVVIGTLAIAALRGRAHEALEDIDQLVKLAPRSLHLASRIPRELIEDILETKRVLVVSPHPRLPIAQEAALKLTENSGVTAIALTPNDAIHGPIAQVTDDVTVLCLASMRGTFDDLGHFLERANGMTRRVWLLDGSGFHRPLNRAIDPLEVGSTVGGLLEMIPLQLLSGTLAVEQGMSPDSPRALAKETLTS